MFRIVLMLWAVLLAAAMYPVAAQSGDEAVAEASAQSSDYDEALAKALGADEYGMRAYVLVILRTGPTPAPAGPERDELFRGHFANMKRLAAEGVLVLAGPLDGEQGRRGIFVLAVTDIDAARAIVATDPVIEKGEMVADYHRYYGSAALMRINEWHGKLAKKSF